MAQRKDKAGKLTDLPNIGKVLAARLHEVGIETVSDLRSLGSVGALLRICAEADDNAPCVNMLYALEGAIRGIRWRTIPRDERARLWRRYRSRVRE
jgi:DNA transformation protein